MQLDPETAEQLEKLCGKDLDWNALMNELLELRERQLESIKPEPVKTESRHIPAKIQQHVVTRTHGACAFPRCTRPYAILHHTQRFALEQVHDPDRLVPLCTAHERLAHKGLVINEQDPPEQWRIALRADRTKPTFKIDQVVMRYRDAVG